MSIIYEALKKTQSNLESKPIFASQKKLRKNKLGKIIFLLLLGLSGLLMVFLCFPKINHPPKKISPPIQAVKIKIPKLDVSHLILNGVFISQNNKVAMINKKVFGIGDTIDGLKIVNIDMHEVKLAQGNKTAALRVFM